MRRPIHLLSRIVWGLSLTCHYIGGILAHASVYLEERDRRRRCVMPLAPIPDARGFPAINTGVGGATR